MPHKESNIKIKENLTKEDLTTIENIKWLDNQLESLVKEVQKRFQVDREQALWEIDIRLVFMHDLRR